ncbi:hypothetical protein MLC59_14645 [Marinobacter bryozoorum]|uniref:hypothetical protein n=1 Tax=Marinobacter bryozoorum TaxID=256324 RepID=UPI002003374A|nr:hypothetical protein [Marinobacter bryozoorum]MCK7545404.1 hypothetical protein [Marinobacter bryozoorum]
MPDYQVFPVGMCHMLAAVMLMVFCLSITLMLVSEIFSRWLAERRLMYLELGLLVVLVLVLATPTFLLSRGWSIFHGFLVWHNRAYLLVLSACLFTVLVDGRYEMAITGGVGLALGFAAHYFYRSERHATAVEHYRLIWEHYRSRGHNHQ